MTTKVCIAATFLLATIEAASACSTSVSEASLEGMTDPRRYESIFSGLAIAYGSEDARHMAPVLMWIDEADRGRQSGLTVVWIERTSCGWIGEAGEYLGVMANTKNGRLTAAVVSYAAPPETSIFSRLRASDDYQGLPTD